MSFLLFLKEQMQNIITRARTVLGNVFRITKERAEKLYVHVLPLGEKLMERVPEGKRRLILIGSAGALVAIILVITAVSLVPQRQSKPRESASPALPPPSSAPTRVVIPQDELFLPFQPDFVPGVMLGREQRTEWTAEDVEPFWQDPLKDGEQQWRDRIEKIIDDLMESVP
jgi:hypothetical protein